MAGKVKNPAAYAAFLESLVASHPKGSADPMPAAKKAAILSRARGLHGKKTPAKKGAPSPFVKGKPNASH